MPSADTNKVASLPDSNIIGGHPKARTQLTKPLVYEGTLDRFTHRELTPAIGREYEGLQVTELLSRDNEKLIRDLAITGTFYRAGSPCTNANGTQFRHVASSFSGIKMSLHNK